MQTEAEKKLSHKRISVLFISLDIILLGYLIYALIKLFN